jgi:malate dehydrogenase
VLDNITETEKKLLEVAVKGLKTNIEKGVDFVKNPPPK